MKKMIITTIFINLLSMFLLAQSNEFTYQGRLLDNSLPPTANYDFEFSLWDSLVAGTRQGTTQTVTGVAVANGIFTVRLNFGAQFTGAARFLEINVRPSGGGAYTTLAPRQSLTSSPYSVRAANSGSADSLSAACVLCITDGHIVSIDGGKVTGTVANAANATTATNVSGIVPIANGGTGSSTKNFVDLSTNQNVFGNKTFNGAVTVAGSNNTLTVDGSLNVDFNVTADQFFGDGAGLTNLNGANITNNTINGSALASDAFPNQQNLKLLGTLRWDLLGQRVAVGSGPRGVAFDGVNIWVANLGSNNVTKLRASDGAVQGTFAVGTGPHAVVFDGADIWTANETSNSVTKLRSSDGANLGTFAVGSFPRGILYDGANIWVANNFSNTVTKLRASDGALQGTFAVGTLPFGVAFDGENIWVANSGSNNVTKLRASDGALLGTFVVGTTPVGVAFDGANIWVGNVNSNNVTKLRTGDGLVQGTFAAGSSPIGVAFDGANIWVANQGSNNVTKLRASDGVNLGTFAVGSFPQGVAFDGANIWVANQNSNNVTKLPVFP